MNIFIPTNGGRSFVYVPTGTSHQGQDQAQPTETSEVNPVAGCLIVGVLIAFSIALLIWANRMMKD